MDTVLGPEADFEREGIAGAGGAAEAVRGFGDEVEGEGDAFYGEGRRGEVFEEGGDLEGDEEVEFGVYVVCGGNVVGGLAEGVREGVVG